MTIDVYSNGALCDEASSMDQLQLGSLDFSRVNTNSMASTNRRVRRLRHAVSLRQHRAEV